MKYFSPILLFIMVFSLLNVSCIHRSYHSKKDSLAVIAPVNGSKVEGWVRLRKMDCGQTLIKAKITGLTPNKKHGFHIHQYGDCRENGKYAGSHLNPYDHEHGSLDSEERHLGDMENLIADENGVAFYEEIVDMCLRKTAGRSVIVHANADDLTSQPSGNAGPYIGCGIIGYVKPLKPKAELSQQNQIIKKTGEFQFQVKRSDVNKHLGHLSEILKDTKLTPYKEKKQVIGFRFEYIKKGSVFDQLGFQESDIVISISGQEIKSASQFGQLFKKAQTQSRVDIVVRRGEKEIKFSWSIKEDVSIITDQTVDKDLEEELNKVDAPQTKIPAVKKTNAQSPPEESQKVKPVTKQNPPEAEQSPPEESQKVKPVTKQNSSEAEQSPPEESQKVKPVTKQNPSPVKKNQQ